MAAWWTKKFQENCAGFALGSGIPDDFILDGDLDNSENEPMVQQLDQMIDQEDIPQNIEPEKVHIEAEERDRLVMEISIRVGLLTPEVAELTQKSFKNMELAVLMTCRNCNWRGNIIEIPSHIVYDCPHGPKKNN